MSTSPELKPCPFCGGAAEFEREGTPRRSCIVACTQCGARHESGDQDWCNGSSWNSRASLSERDAPKPFHESSYAIPLEHRLKAATTDFHHPRLGIHSTGHHTIPLTTQEAVHLLALYKAHGEGFSGAGDAAPPRDTDSKP